MSSFNTKINKTHRQNSFINLDVAMTTQRRIQDYSVQVFYGSKFDPQPQTNRKLEF